ncbi:MAG: response regulator [Candidatus Saccharimonadales bacterium]
MKQVLLVEPDTILAKTIASYLMNRGLAVSTATTAQAAIASADATLPDVVILELAMPNHNGIEFLQEFRSYSDWTNIPIIVYSHIPQEDTGLSAAEWHKYGAVDYLYKPTIGLERLAAILQNSAVSAVEA